MRQILIPLFCALMLLFSASSFAASPKTWTFLVYLNGNNDLDNFGLNSLLSMEQVGSNDQVNIVVQWASLREGKTVRMLVLKTKNSSELSPVVEDLGNVDMGNYKTLEDFIAWGVKNYPADHYFIDVWGHGSGWHEIAGSKSNPKQIMGDISYDENTGHTITTEQLGEVMRYAANVIGHKVDIYGSDSCLMGMAEVADEMKNSVSYFIGSQEVSPSLSWPYYRILLHWEAQPKAASDQVVKIVVDDYVKFYQDQDEGEAVTISAYDLNQLSRFNQGIANLKNQLLQLSPDERAAALRAAKNTQRFDVYDYADVLDFIKNLESAHLNIDKAVLSQVRSATASLVIANNVTLPAYHDANGISIWLPITQGNYKTHTDRYQKLAFNVDTKWNDAAGALLQGSH